MTNIKFNFNILRYIAYILYPNITRHITTKFLFSFIGHLPKFSNNLYYLFHANMLFHLPD